MPSPQSKRESEREAGTEQPPGAAMPSNNVRQFISLALFIHLFCVLVVMSANMQRSPLQSRVVRVLRPYTQVFNFELDYVPYYLTHATEFDVDHRIEVLPQGADPEDRDQWTSISEGRTRGGQPYRRFQRFARVLDFFSAQQGADETLPGIVAEDVAEHYVHQHEIVPARVRCRRHVLQNREVIAAGTPEQRDPWDEETYFRTPYQANVLVDEKRDVDVVKIDPESQVAQPDASPSGTQ